MQKNLARLFLSVFLCVSFIAQSQAQEKLPRTVILLYQPNPEDSPNYLLGLSRILETPLNHLGLIVEYHNIETGLPDLKNRQDVRGILTWYDQNKSVNNPHQYVKWLSAQIDRGRKIVMMEELGFMSEYKHWQTKQEDIKELLAKLGLQLLNPRDFQIFDVKITHKNPRMVEFERKFDSYIPTFDWGQWIGLTEGKDKGESHLTASHDKAEFALVVTHKNGGYVSQNYSLYRQENKEDLYRAWYINPFAFFRKAFGLETLPMPDTTTLSGNRLYYSHIDGDGWNNLTQLEEYKGKEALCAKVIYEKIFLAYPDMPVTVGPIGADLDTSWAGSKKSQDIASKIFQLPHIEVASHTFSHPFSWRFFEDGDVEKEKVYFPYYPEGYTWENPHEKDSLISKTSHRLKTLLGTEKEKKTPKGLMVDGIYDVPRGFAHHPFDIKQEIKGSCTLIDHFSPTNKPVKIILWSGNTTPYSEALELANALGIQNLNGGDNRFDWENDSYSWIAPKGRKVGNYWQVYASCANETIYTRTWKERFYAYRDLIQTVKNTESPLRLLPFNIYYHIYIGEKKASLDALIDNLNYAKTQDLCPISASHYAKIVQGFYKTDLIQLSSQKWKILNRGDLQTLRFDNAALKGVDFSTSKGVIGQRHFQGSLYVYLDKHEKSPLLSLKDLSTFGQEPREKTLYLIQSNWPIENMSQSLQKTSFTAQGFGEGHLIWKTPTKGTFKIRIQRDQNILHEKTLPVGDDLRLTLSLPFKAIEPLQITIIQEPNHV